MRRDYDYKRSAITDDRTDTASRFLLILMKLGLKSPSKFIFQHKMLAYSKIREYVVRVEEVEMI